MSLPRPITTTDFYLAAILDELRGLRADLAQPPETAEIELRETPLPGNFPGHEALVAAGITCLESVPNDGDSLVQIKGIGKATANQILLRLINR